MRCASFCTANSYNLLAITDFFKSQNYFVKSYNKILHVSNLATDMFFFHHGCVVTWGLRTLEEQALLKQIKFFSIEPIERVESDYFLVKVGKETKIIPHERFNVDIIIIDAEDVKDAAVKLAISYGLAQSVKLGSYEGMVDGTINKNSQIAKNLSTRGKIFISRKEISKDIGEIFREKILINLSSDFLDAPEFFWEYSNVENYYLMTEKFLDVHKRVTALNKKLNLLQEIFEMLNNQLQHRYSNFLEIVIILLIAIEIIFNLFHLF